MGSDIAGHLGDCFGTFSVSIMHTENGPRGLFMNPSSVLKLGFFLLTTSLSLSGSYFSNMVNGSVSAVDMQGIKYLEKAVLSRHWRN